MPHMAGHLLSLPHLAGCGALTDGTWMPNPVRGPVSRLLSSEVVALHHTGESLALGRAYDIDEHRSFKRGDIDRLTNFILVIRVNMEDQNHLPMGIYENSELPPPHILTSKMVDLANERGGDDNITVVCWAAEVG